MKKNQIRAMSLSGVFATLVFVITAYLHIPTYNGYVHVGDGFVFLAACLLPTPYAVAVGAIGAMLADVLTGFAIWAPGSMVIKALMAVLFSCKGKKILSLRNILVLIPAALISIGGYYFYVVIITGSFVASLSGIPGSAIQAATSSLVFIIAGLAMDKFNIKKTLIEDYQK